MKEEILSTDENSEIFLNTVCFSGNREIPAEEMNYVLLRTETMIRSILHFGYRTFLCGMAMGFDSIAFDILQKMKAEYPDIKVVACVPCKGQEKYFPEDEKKAYRRRIEQADRVICFSEKYTRYCMMERNIFMVDHSDIVVGYSRKTSGGTVNTLDYAKRKCREVMAV